MRYRDLPLESVTIPHTKTMVKTLVREALDGLVSDLRSTHGDNLASVVLYGSAAAGDQVELRSDYNLLIALNRITPEDLRLAQAPMREWQRLGNPLPVYFTCRGTLRRCRRISDRVSPDGKCADYTFGSDPFEFVKLSDTHLRHQAEYELRSKLIQLRRLYIPASVSVEKLGDLMTTVWRVSLLCFVRC